MHLHKYITIGTLKKIIGGSIRFTQPGAFNDPFELVPELHAPKTDNKDISISFDLQAPRRKPPVGELPDDFRSEFCSDLNSRKIVQELNNSIGILCLSQTYNSLLMWSHYADEYRGAIVTFNKEHDFFKGLIEIDYRENRPKKDISAYINSAEPVPISELCIKPKDWQYESEIRVIRSLNDCVKVAVGENHPVYVMDIPIECIKSVTLGERTPVVQQREIYDLIKDTDISLSLAAVANWSYQFRDELIKHENPVSEMPPIISPRTAHIFSELNNEIGESARWILENHKHSEIVNETL
jgi:hypothetical protein